MTHPTTTTSPTTAPGPPGHSATARRVLGLPPPPGTTPLRAAGRRALQRVGGPVGLVAGAAPTVAFVAVEAARGLPAGLLASATTAVVACAVRLARREAPGPAVAGLLVAAVCAGAAAVVGEARAFFLPTTLLPVAFVVAYLVAFAVGRPLTGVVTTALGGGPRDWPRRPRLLRVHVACSAVGLVLASTNLAVRVALYVADEPAALAVVQVVSTTVFALHAAVTVVLARRAAGGPLAATP